MDFIERLFGMAPDGGDGSLELVWIAALLVAVGAVRYRRPALRWLEARRSRRPE